MQKIVELKSKLAAAKEALADLDAEIRVMQARKAAIDEKSAAVGAELTSALAAARTAATAYALGNGDEAEIVQAQTAVMKLEASRAALEAALLAICEELEKLQEPRKAAAARVDRLRDMIYSQISELELRKTVVFIKRAHRAFCKQPASYMHKDSFSRAVADLVHHCRHEDAEKVSQELSTIYGLDI